MYVCVISAVQSSHGLSIFSSQRIDLLKENSIDQKVILPELYFDRMNDLSAVLFDACSKGVAKTQKTKYPLTMAQVLNQYSHISRMLFTDTKVHVLWNVQFHILSIQL